MLIDWFTVGAQAVNFIVLVWLLKRFLYKPILKAIDDREKRIAAKIADAGDQKAEAENERKEFQRKNRELDDRKAEILLKASEEARAGRQRVIEEARKTADDLGKKRREALRIEELNLHQEIIRRTGREVFAVARKALADLAGTNLEERMVAVFVDRLSGLNEEEKVLLSSALTASAGPLTVRTTFDLSKEDADRVETAVKTILKTETAVRFETAPGLIAGIELSANGHKVGWSIEDYLSTLEMGIDELVGEKDGPKPPSDTPMQTAVRG